MHSVLCFWTIFFSLCHGSPSSFDNVMSQRWKEDIVHEVIQQKPILIRNPRRNNQLRRLCKDKAKKVGCWLAEQLNKSLIKVVDPTALSSITITKLISGCDVDIHHASTLSSYLQNKLFAPSPNDMSTCNASKRLYVLSHNNLSRLNKIRKMVLSSVESTLAELCDSILDTLCIDDPVLSDNMSSSSDRRSDGEVTDSLPYLMSHILIECDTMDTSNMKTTHLPDVGVTTCSGLIPSHSLET